MSFSNFAKATMLTQLLLTTKAVDGTHRVKLGSNGTIIPEAAVLSVALKVYGHNPPVITNTSTAQWTAASSWATPITDVYIVNATSEDVLLTGKLDSPYPMSIGTIFEVPALSWEASLV